MACSRMREYTNTMNESLQLLSSLHFSSKKNKYRRVPEYALPKNKFTDSTANGLTKAIIEWLSLNGCYAVRVSSAGRYLPGSKKFIPSTTKKGTADIHAVINGRHVSIEVKVGRDRMSADQIKTKQDIERAGGLFFVAHSFEGFLFFYNQTINSNGNCTSI